MSEAAADPACRFRPSEGGFTLVELMVVITVIGLTAAIAMWTMPDPGGRVADEAARFAARVKAAHDEAVVGGTPVGLWVTTGGYGFDARVEGRWVPMSDKPLRVARWQDGTRARLSDAGGRARVVFDATGLADHPLEVRLERRGASSSIHVEADGGVRTDA